MALENCKFESKLSKKNLRKSQEMLKNLKSKYPKNSIKPRHQTVA